jgi:hypothetical protein
MHVGCQGSNILLERLFWERWVCIEAGVDENDEAAIGQARKRADAERADSAQKYRGNTNGAT